MKYIIQIGSLYDNYHEMNFGYVGIDLNTGEKHYYSNYDSKGNWSFRSITEFDMDNKEKLNRFLRSNLYHCYYNKDGSEKIPEDVKSLAYKMIDKHLIYNKQNGYPIDDLEKNLNNLSFKYVSNISLFGDLGFSGRYIPVKNTIEMPITNIDWQRYGEDEIKETEDILLHETGHLKVSNYSLDIKNKELKVRTGFYTSIVKVEPVMLSNGDIFLKFEGTLDLCKRNEDRILEEVMNDFDCKEINPNFVPTYPNVGYILNDLCDGRLQKARYYDDGIEELYDSLNKLIKGRDLVNELLLSIVETNRSFEDNYDENEAHIMKLLKKYQQVRNRR